MIRFLLLLLFSVPALATTGTCTWNADSATLSLSCSTGETPPPPPPPPVVTPPITGCIPPTYTNTFNHTGQFFDFSLATGQVARLQLPPIAGGSWAEVIVFQSTGTPSDLQAEASISEACATFDVPKECKQAGSAWSSIDLYSFTPPTYGYCGLVPTTTYYMNVRNTNCGLDRCPMRAQYIGGKR